MCCYCFFNHHIFSQIVEGLAEAMTFGVLQRCQACNSGLLEFRMGLSGMSYYCSEEDEWTSCASYFDKPLRSVFVIPKSLKGVSKDSNKLFL